MFFLVWRGYGLLGLVPPILGLVALGFLSDYSIKVAVLGAALAITIFGAGLAVTGWWLNRNGNHHSLYGLPLWFWAGLEAILGLTLAGWVVLQVINYGWNGDFR
jgi:hypothetical protein